MDKITEDEMLENIMSFLEGLDSVELAEDFQRRAPCEVHVGDKVLFPKQFVELYNSWTGSDLTVHDVKWNNSILNERYAKEKEQAEN